MRWRNGKTLMSGVLGIKTFSEEWSSTQIVTQNFRQIVNERIPLGLVVR